MLSDSHTKKIERGASRWIYGGGASLETFSGEAQLKKPPCIFCGLMTIAIVLGHKTAWEYCGNDEYLISFYNADFASDMLQTLFAQSAKQLDYHSNNNFTENENADLAKI